MVNITAVQLSYGNNCHSYQIITYTSREPCVVNCCNYYVFKTHPHPLPGQERGRLRGDLERAFPFLNLLAG